MPDNSEAVTKTKINFETAEIPWLELQRFFAAGQCVYVGQALDLVEVAYRLARDDAAQIKIWMETNQLAKVSDEQAKCWLAEEVSLWSVVVKPWVLVQQREREELD